MKKKAALGKGLGALLRGSGSAIGEGYAAGFGAANASGFGAANAAGSVTANAAGFGAANAAGAMSANASGGAAAFNAAAMGEGEPAAYGTFAASAEHGASSEHAAGPEYGASSEHAAGSEAAARLVSQSGEAFAQSGKAFAQGGAAAGHGHPQDAVANIDIDLIEPNPNQPRKSFDPDALASLAASIKSVGVVSPIIVTDEGSFYRIVAGERRWRAAKQAGLKAVPALVRDLDAARRAEVALVENLQRQDLNPIEEARGYELLAAEHGYTQDMLAKAVGKSRSAVANSMRLLKLSPRALALVERGRLTPGHARALLSVEPDEFQDLLANEIVEQELSVRQAENLAGDDSYIKRLAKAGGVAVAAPARGSGQSLGNNRPQGDDGGRDGNAGGQYGDAGGQDGNAGGQRDADGPFAEPGGRLGGAAQADGFSAVSMAGGARTELPLAQLSAQLSAQPAVEVAAIRRVEGALMERLGTKVFLSPKGRVGRIVIEYVGTDDLQRLLEILGVAVE